MKMEIGSSYESGGLVLLMGNFYAGAYLHIIARLQ
jgi:hypothetical protein